MGAVRDLPFQLLVTRFELMLVALSLFYLVGWPEDRIVCLLDVQSHENTTTFTVCARTFQCPTASIIADDDTVAIEEEDALLPG